jgi:hypothetical protein
MLLTAFGAGQASDNNEGNPFNQFKYVLQQEIIFVIL